MNATCDINNWLFPDLGYYTDQLIGDVTYLSNGIGVAIVDITPQMAQAMLATNVENQRKIHKPHVLKYANDMKNGQWWTTHEGIAFNHSGNLCDGQHRLSALIESGVESIQMLVFLGAGGNREMGAMNIGKVRSILESTKVAGNPLSSREIATLKAGLVSGSKSIVIRKEYNAQTSPQAFSEIFEKYKTEIRKVEAWFQGQGAVVKGNTAAVRAAVVAALLEGCSEPKLKRFVEIITRQVSDVQPGENAAFYFEKYQPPSMNGRDVYRAIYCKTTDAIHKFLAGRDARPVVIEKPRYEFPDG